MELNLHLFDTTYTVTVKKDANITTATASAASGAKGTEITLTITPATGYAIDDIECVEGGVTVDMETKKFTIGEANVLLFVKSKAANNYLVTEECMICVNDAKTVLHRNAMVVLTPNGVPKAVNAAGGGTVIAANDAVQSLIDQGILVPM